MQTLLRPCFKRNWSSGNSVAMSLSKLQGVKLPASADFHGTFALECCFGFTIFYFIMLYCISFYSAFKNEFS